MNKLHPLSAAILAAAVSAPAVANDDIETIYINPFAGYQYFDDKRDLDEEATYGFGLEYRFLPQWAVEAVYSRANPDIKGSSGDVDFEEVRVDGLYYFGSQSDKVNPYLAAGVGHADFDGGTSTTPGTEHDETRVNLGGGVRYNMTDLVSLRADLRALHGVDESTFDAQASLGLSLAFSRTTSEPEPPLPNRLQSRNRIATAMVCPTTVTSAPARFPAQPLTRMAANWTATVTVSWIAWMNAPAPSLARKWMSAVVKRSPWKPSRCM